MKGIESLVAINVLVNDRIINKNGIPLLYYNNGDNDILDSIKNDQSFVQLLKDTNVLTIDNFGNSYIALFNYHNKKCDNINKEIQNLFPISDELYVSFIQTIIYDLINQIFPNKVFTSYKDAIPQLLSDKVSDEILFTYVKSELSTKYNLHQDNIKYIINKLTDEIRL